MTRRGIFYYVILVMLIFASLMFLPPLLLYGGDDISTFPNCPICGMSRDKFAHSRMLVHYQDGSTFASCSLHCTALELAYRPGQVPIKIEVGDYTTKTLFDAEQAVWVLGGSRPGVMTANAKWAFGDQDAARQFVAQNGGRIVDFETALAAAYADMYQDTRMIRQKRQQKAHQK
jgi:copper chaperone NosL